MGQGTRPKDLSPISDASVVRTRLEGGYVVTNTEDSGRLTYYADLVHEGKSLESFVPSLAVRETFGTENRFGVPMERIFQATASTPEGVYRVSSETPKGGSPVVIREGSFLMPNIPDERVDIHIQDGAARIATTVRQTDQTLLSRLYEATMVNGRPEIVIYQPVENYGANIAERCPQSAADFVFNNVKPPLAAGRLAGMSEINSCSDAMAHMESSKVPFIVRNPDPTFASLQGKTPEKYVNQHPTSQSNIVSPHLAIF